MKKFVFGLIATVFMGAAVNAQSTPKGFSALSDLRFGKISSYAGPCVSGMGMCSGTVVTNPDFFSAGISKVSETAVSYAFSKEFYQANVQYLSRGLDVTDSYSLPQSVTSKIGISGEFVVAPGTYQVTAKEGYYFLTLDRRY